jgi:hypothetical protein
MEYGVWSIEYRGDERTEWRAEWRTESTIEELLR